jgi:hypothetical protein
MPESLQVVSLLQSLLLLQGALLVRHDPQRMKIGTASPSATVALSYRRDRGRSRTAWPAVTVENPRRRWSRRPATALAQNASGSWRALSHYVHPSKHLLAHQPALQFRPRYTSSLGATSSDGRALRPCRDAQMSASSHAGNLYRAGPRTHVRQSRLSGQRLAVRCRHSRGGKRGKRRCVHKPGPNHLIQNRLITQVTSDRFSDLHRHPGNGRIVGRDPHERKDAFSASRVLDVGGSRPRSDPRCTSPAQSGTSARPDGRGHRGWPSILQLSAILRASRPGATHPTNRQAVSSRRRDRTKSQR